MSNSDLRAVRNHPVPATIADATTLGRNRVKGLSSWRGAKIGAIAFPAWMALLSGLQILIDADALKDDDPGERIILAAAIVAYGAVFGFFFGLFSGAIVGAAYELFGSKAAAATGFIIPLAIAVALLEWRLSFDLWDYPGHHISELGVLILATVLPLIIIVSQHVRVLQNYATSPVKFGAKPASGQPLAVRVDL